MAVTTKHNGINRAGRKTYRIHSEQTQDGYPSETATMEYNSGRYSADRGILGTWTVRSLNTGSEMFDSFEGAAVEFTERTGESPPRPGWLDE